MNEYNENEEDNNMVNMPIKKIENIIQYLNMLEETIKDDDTRLSIDEIKKDLMDGAISNKLDILDELNNMIMLISSLREQMFVLSNNEKTILVNTEIYTYAICKNLEDMQNHLYELLQSLEDFTIQINKL